MNWSSLNQRLGVAVPGVANLASIGWLQKETITLDPQRIVHLRPVLYRLRIQIPNRKICSARRSDISIINEQKQGMMHLSVQPTNIQKN